MTEANVLHYCFVCGAGCAVAGSGIEKLDGVRIMGRLYGEPTCDVCIGNEQLGRLQSGDSEIVYISSDGKTFTTWGGVKLGTIHELGGTGGTWSEQALTRIMARLPVKCVHWSGVTEDGVLVYGRTQGHGMCATAHPRRKKGRIMVEAGSRIALEGVRA